MMDTKVVNSYNLAGFEVVLYRLLHGSVVENGWLRFFALRDAATTIRGYDIMSETSCLCF